MAVLKRADLDKPYVNRKLIGWLFVGTGILSLAIWLAGWRNKAGGVWESKTISFEIQPPAIKKSRDDSLKTRQLVDRLRERLAGTTGTYGIFVYRFQDRVSYGINEEEVMPGASILKIPAMIAVHQAVESGTMSLDDIYVLSDADKRTGSGPLEYMTAGTRLPIRRLLLELGKKSDNTAWVALNKRLGMATMQEAMTDMGMTSSNYQAGETTAIDVGKMWQQLYESKIVSPDHRDQIWEYLRDSIYEDRITKGVPEGVDLVHKVGTDVGVWADSGIVLGWKQAGTPEPEATDITTERVEIEPFVIVVLNRDAKRDEAEDLVPELVGMIWDHETSR